MPTKSISILIYEALSSLQSDTPKFFWHLPLVGVSKRENQEYQYFLIQCTMQMSLSILPKLQPISK